MSKLADAIRRTQRIESAPMGFGAARLAPKATMLVGYTAGDAAGLQSGREAGADVVLLTSGGAVATADVEKLKAAAGDAAAGVRGQFAPEAAAELQKAGLDFVVVDADSTRAAVLLNEDLGFVLALPEAPDELFLRSLEPLSLEAVLLHGSSAEPLTVTRQIELSRIAMLARKPLLVSVDAGIAKEELECLRAAGAAVVLVSGAPDSVAKLKETVLTLPPRRVRREDRAVVSLPSRHVHEHDHDHDDDDDP
jgi:hypothetical protein